MTPPRTRKSRAAATPSAQRRNTLDERLSSIEKRLAAIEGKLSVRAVPAPRGRRAHTPRRWRLPRA